MRLRCFSWYLQVLRSPLRGALRHRENPFVASSFSCGSAPRDRRRLWWNSETNPAEPERTQAPLIPLRDSPSPGIGALSIAAGFTGSEFVHLACAMRSGED